MPHQFVFLLVVVMQVLQKTFQEVAQKNIHCQLKMFNWKLQNREGWERICWTWTQKFFLLATVVKCTYFATPKHSRLCSASSYFSLLLRVKILSIFQLRSWKYAIGKEVVSQLFVGFIAFFSTLFFGGRMFFLPSMKKKVVCCSNNQFLHNAIFLNDK